MSALLDAALSYAALGRHIFPLQWAVDGKCSCGREDCNSPAKHPRTEHGLSDATANEAKIRDWWEAHPQANIGMVMGDGLIAIDVDPRKDGDESLAGMGELPDTVTALTGGGGQHLIYHADEDYGNGAGIAPGVDVRSGGGYIVVPPSLHVSGRRYEWEVGHGPGEMKPAPLPDVFKELMRNGRTAAPPVSEIIPDGKRHDTLASIAGTMRRRGMDETEMAAALLVINARRCQPPLPDREVERIAASYAKYPAGEELRPGLLGPEGDSPSLAGPVLVQLSRVQREEVHWLWQDRIPLGRLTGIVGDPGFGKSWLTLAVGAAVTRGVGLPGQAASEPGRVLLLTAEDGLSDTVRPRLEDMGAELERVTVLTAVRDDKGNERHPSLLTDIPMLEAALGDGGYSLIIIDPVNAYLGVDLDTHRDAPLRSVLGPLAALAERWRLAALFVLHLNKSQKERAIYRAQGGIAYVAAARVVHLVGQNPDDEAERVFATIKNNLAAFPTALAFEMGEGQFAWRGETAVTPAALLGPDGDEEGRSALDEAVGFLRIILADGPFSAKQVQREAHEAGISERTLHRGKAVLGVKSERQGEAGEQGGGTWKWGLPNVKAAKNTDTEKLAALTPSDREPPQPTSAIGNLNPDGGQRLYALSLWQQHGQPSTLTLSEGKTVSDPEKAIANANADDLAALIRAFEEMN